MLKTGSRFIRHALGAALLAITANAGAALPATSAGAFDPTFNAGTVLYKKMFEYFDFGIAVALRPDGKMLLSGYGKNLDHEEATTYISRYNADGSLDTGFANGGTRKFAEFKPANGMAVAQDGTIVLAGDLIVGVYPNEVYHAWMTRLNADGSTDAAFAGNGELVASCSPRPQCVYIRVARHADGKLAVLGNGWDQDYTNDGIGFIDRYLADGTPDPSFGTGGRVVLGANLAGIDLNQIRIDREGRYLVTGTLPDAGTKNNKGFIARFTSDGQLDPSFSGSGLVTINIDGLWTDFRDFDIQPDGRIVIGASSYDSKASGIRYFAHVVRLLPEGTLDPSFGTAGVAKLGGGYGNGVRLQSNGAMIFYGQGVITGKTSYVPMAARVLPNGQLDPAFGTGGIVLTDPASTQTTLMDVAIGEDNRIAAAGYAYHNSFVGRHSTLVRMIGSETTTNVIEFHNATLNHYFVTADPNEAAAIDSGAAGPGWSRTGAAWKSGGPMRVCRFYGSPEVNAKTGMRMGPNSHFYTISTEECAVVKQDEGWKFESYDFSGWPRAVDGSCAAGTIAVKRVYNNRFAVNDSNHRYMTSDAIYAQMVAQGWSGEGTVFCAPL